MLYPVYHQTRPPIFFSFTLWLLHMYSAGTRAGWGLFSALCTSICTLQSPFWGAPQCAIYGAWPSSCPYSLLPTLVGSTALANGFLSQSSLRTWGPCN